MRLDKWVADPNRVEPNTDTGYLEHAAPAPAPARISTSTDQHQHGSAPPSTQAAGAQVCKAQGSKS